jgi:nitrate reductase gamma subunit
MPPAIDVLLFVALPYAAVLLCAVGTVERYRRHQASVTSLSSQFFEARRHFWGYMPFHLGILVVLAAHLAWFFAPGLVEWWNGSPARLYGGEVFVLTCGICAVTGYAAIGLRRRADRRLRLVTSAWDWAVYAMLLVQIVLGIVIAVRYSWGSGWFAAIVAPYLWSLARFSPDIAAVAALPQPVVAHIVAAWLLVAVFPFSRLVHVLAVPNPYLWRPPQVVRWRRETAVARGDRS